jgi:hypothetical protein
MFIMPLSCQHTNKKKKEAKKKKSIVITTVNYF